jgi:hypothetical protein
MTTIATFTLPEDAHLFRTFLESRGIEGFVLDEHFVQLFWHYSNAVGGVRVAVNEEDADDARNLHQEYMSSLRAGPYPLQPVRAWPVVILLSIILGAPLLLFGRRAVRTDAGNSH